MRGQTGLEIAGILQPLTGLRSYTLQSTDSHIRCHCCHAAGTRRCACTTRSLTGNVFGFPWPGYWPVNKAHRTPGPTTPHSHIHPTGAKTLWSLQMPGPPHNPPQHPKAGKLQFHEGAGGGIVLRGLLYTPHPSCCHCQATATGKCQGANLRREKGGPAS